jgi:hypothetical protein
MPPRELSPTASPEYAIGYYTAWRQQPRDSPYYNRAQTERYKRGYEQAEMEGALANMPAPAPVPAWMTEPLISVEDGSPASTVVGLVFLFILIVVVVGINVS